MLWTSLYLYLILKILKLIIRKVMPILFNNWLCGKQLSIISDRYDVFFFIHVIIKKKDYNQTYLLIDTFNTCDNYYYDCDNWKFTSQYHFLLS